MGESNLTHTHPQTITNNKQQDASDLKTNTDIYTLDSSFGFYKGTKDMSEITSITFGNDAPEEYDECWTADTMNSGSIMGFLSGKSVSIIGDIIYANPRCAYMFASYNGHGEPLWSNLSEINGLDLLDTSKVTNMKLMFAYSALEELHGIENWDVSNVSTFTGMFQGNDNSGDVKLRNLNIGNWDTSSATDMSYMFYGCANLTYIPIENWDVSKVSTFSHMFADCYNLKNIDFSKWKTKSVLSFDGFLNDCHSVITVDMSSFETGTCVQFSQMFESCIKLERIFGIETFDVSSANTYAFSEMFHGCHSIKELDLSRWIAAPDNTARMFKDCHNIEYIDVSGINMNQVQHDDEMFENCYNLSTLHMGLK